MSAADSKIEYDENGTDQLTFTGADVRFNITTQSNSKDTGSLFTEGGLGVEKECQYRWKLKCNWYINI